MRLFAFILSVLLSYRAAADFTADLRSFGQTAPVQLYLFTSLTCPHCADFHKKILPTLKKEYAQTGKAQILIVDMISNKNGLIATQLLHCLDPDSASRLEDDLYASQAKWMRQDAPKARKILQEYASRQKMTKEQVNQCLLDDQLQKAILQQQVNLARLYDITGTPTLLMRRGNKVYKWAGSDKQVFKQLNEAFQQ